MLRINKNEKVKEFNQRFIILLNRIPDKPTKVVQIEYYTFTLMPPVAMFVKRKEIRNLAENFLEAIKVEKDLATISHHPRMRKVKPPPQKRMGRRTRRQS